MEELSRASGSGLFLVVFLLSSLSGIYEVPRETYVVKDVTPKDLVIISGYDIHIITCI